MALLDLTPKQVEELKNHYILELEKLQQYSAEIIGILKTMIHEPVHFEEQPGTSIIKSTHLGKQKKPVIQTGEKRKRRGRPSGSPIKSTLPAEQKEAVIQTEEKKRRGRPPGSQIKSSLPAEQIKAINKTEEKTKRRGRPSNNPLWGEFIIQLLKEKGKPQLREQIIHAYQKQFNVEVSGSKSAMSALNQALQHLRVRKKQITSIGREGKKGKLFALINSADISAENVKARQKKHSIISPKETPSTETNYNWSQFILDTLAKTKKILSIKDFYNYAMAERMIPASEKKSIYGKLSPLLTQMVRRKDTIRTVKKDGLNTKLYGLNEWFGSNQELITIYQ